MNRPASLEIHDRICDELYGRKEKSLPQLEGEIEAILRTILPHEEMRDYKVHDRGIERYIQEHNHSLDHGFHHGHDGLHHGHALDHNNDEYDHSGYTRPANLSGKEHSRSSTFRKQIGTTIDDSGSRKMFKDYSNIEEDDPYGVNYTHLWDTSFDQGFDHGNEGGANYDFERGSVYSATSPLFTGQLSVGVSPGKKYWTTRTNSPKKQRNPNNHYSSRMRDSPNGNNYNRMRGSPGFPSSRTPPNKSPRSPPNQSPRSDRSDNSGGYFVDRDDQSRRVLQLSKQIHRMLGEFPGTANSPEPNISSRASMSPREKSPRMSPREKSPRMSPREKSPRMSPREKSPRMSPREKSPRHVTISHEGTPRTETPRAGSRNQTGAITSDFNDLYNRSFEGEKSHGRGQDHHSRDHEHHSRDRDHHSRDDHDEDGEEEDGRTISSITEHGPVHLSFGETEHDGEKIRQKRERVEKDVLRRLELHQPYESIREREFPRLDEDPYTGATNEFADELCLTEMVSLLADGIRRGIRRRGEDAGGDPGNEDLVTDAETMCLRVAEIEAESKSLHKSMQQLEKKLEQM